MTTIDAYPEPQSTRRGEQLILQVGNGDDIDDNWYVPYADRPHYWAWGFGYSYETAVANAREVSKRTGKPILLRGRVRMNDYVGSPIWGNYVTYGEVLA